jgi:bifunctional DNase/RNase
MSGIARVEVIGVRVEMPSNQPIVLLRETEGERYLPIWIGAVEATAIAFAQQGIQPPRPMTHDLLNTVMERTGHALQSVLLTEIKDGIFYAEITLEGDLQISARPSDAIALALRNSRPIFAKVELLAQAGIDIPKDPEGEGAQEEAVERFREFLDQITPEDFIS